MSPLKNPWEEENYIVERPRLDKKPFSLASICMRGIMFLNSVPVILVIIHNSAKSEKTVSQLYET